MSNELIGNIVTPKEAFHGKLAWEGERISSIDKLGEVKSDALWIVPGFIDIHLHGLGNGTAETIEGIREMAKFGVTVGISRFCPTLSCAPRDYLVNMMVHIRMLMEEAPDGSIIAGTHCEGPWLDMVHKGGMHADGLRYPAMDEAMEYIKAAQGTLKILAIAPELPGALQVIRYLAENGVKISAGHTACPPDFLDEAVKAGVSQLTHIFDAYDCPEQHQGVRQPALTDMAIIDDRIMKEIILDGIHVPAPLVKLTIRGAGVDHVVGITDAMQGAGVPDGRYQDLGEWYRIKGDDVARNEKDNSIIGSSLTPNRSFNNIINKFGFSPVDASKLLSTNPASILGLENQTGSLKKGLLADITVLEPDCKSVNKCYIQGKLKFNGQGR